MGCRVATPRFEPGTQPGFKPTALHEGEFLARHGRLVVEVGAALRAVPVQHDQAQLVRVGVRARVRGLPRVRVRWG